MLPTIPTNIYEWPQKLALGTSIGNLGSAGKTQTVNFVGNAVPNAIYSQWVFIAITSG